MVKLFIESIKLNIKSQIEYKASFIINSISQLFVFFSYYFMILALFNKFNNIKGFTLYEILLCFSIIHLGFAFNETFFRGIDRFEDYIIDGSLDRFLVRPRGILFQALSAQIDLIKGLKIIQAIIILIISLINLNIVWNISKVIVLILCIISSILIFFGIFILTASYCFVTVQGLEVKNLFTDGGKHMAQYPIGIYRKGIVFVFTFIIPYAFINYYPLLYFLDKTNNTLYMFSPLLVLLFLVPCLLSFKIGLKHYSSTGS
ncbi:MAG: ABC-2 family transporter protein [Bacilli bacterium]|nr:ABC-2 family transporter protein [Bacilli bacterium]